MNHQRIIDSIIKTGKKRGLTSRKKKGFHRHHIKLKCLGGTNDVRNLVDLTYREHYIVHKLLTRVHSENEYIRAFSRMYQWGSTSKQYEAYWNEKIKLSPSKNFTFKGKKHDEATLEKMSSAWDKMPCAKKAKHDENCSVGRKATWDKKTDEEKKQHARNSFGDSATISKRSTEVNNRRWAKSRRDKGQPPKPGDERYI